jgi:Fms-interacting protein/Thoc5
MHADYDSVVSEFMLHGSHRRDGTRVRVTMLGHGGETRAEVVVIDLHRCTFDPDQALGPTATDPSPGPTGSVPDPISSHDMMQPDYSEEVILALRQLATADDDDVASPNDDPASVHIRAGAHFARLKALNRDANAAARAHKQITADARHDMDQTHLRLQNLLYEKRHLEREIEKCRQFACVPPFFRFPRSLAHEAPPVLYTRTSRCIPSNSS